MPKGKTKHHTAKELKRKQALKAQKNARKGGKKAKDNRNPIKKAYKCYVCSSPCPDEKTMKIHFENKHRKVFKDFSIEKCVM